MASHTDHQHGCEDGGEVGSCKDLWEEKGYPEFHDTQENKLFKFYFEKELNDAKNLKVFLPLCGMSPDLLWLAKKGHTVVGVEVSEIAVRRFFEELNLEFKVETPDELAGTLYQATGMNLRIYNCDYFDFNKNFEEPFDVVIDRGSYLEFSDNDTWSKSYTDNLKSLIGESAVILFLWFEMYDPDSPKNFLKFMGADYNSTIYKTNEIESQDEKLVLFKKL